VLKSPVVKRDTKPKSAPGRWNDFQIAGLMAQTGCLVAIAVFAFLAAGVWLDKILHTRPFFTLVLVLGSMPLTLFGLYRFAVRAVSRLPHSPPGATEGIRTDDDDA
jgi:hypothetical protein